MFWQIEILKRWACYFKRSYRKGYVEFIVKTKISRKNIQFSLKQFFSGGFTHMGEQ